MRWRRPVKVVEKVVYREDNFYREEYDKFTSAVRHEVKQHSPYFSGEHIADWSETNFWCAVCRSPWPCRFLRWAYKATGGDGEIAPLMLTITRRSSSERGPA